MVLPLGEERNLNLAGACQLGGQQGAEGPASNLEHTRAHVRRLAGGKPGRFGLRLLTNRRPLGNAGYGVFDG